MGAVTKDHVSLAPARVSFGLGPTLLRPHIGGMAPSYTRPELPSVVRERWQVTERTAPHHQPSNAEPDVTDKRRGDEIGEHDGPEPTRFGDWEHNGRCVDF
jgi:hypothetical protein